MKNKRKVHLNYYNHHVLTGYMDHSGLCTEEVNFKNLELFTPTDEDYRNFEIHQSPLGRDYDYWGSGDKYSRHLEFTPLRQTIILFLAAMAGELDKK